MDPLLSNAASSDGQIYQSSAASSTRYILGANPSGSAACMADVQHQNQHQHQQQPSHPVHHITYQPPLPKRHPFHSILSGLGGRSGRPRSSGCSIVVSKTQSIEKGPDSVSTLSGRSSAQQDARSDHLGSDADVDHARVRVRSGKTDSQVDFERGYLRISASMVEEIIKYRRMLVLLFFALLYALFAMGAVVFKPAPNGSHSAASSSRHLNADEWTQEMIAGWHRDRPLVLTSNELGNRADGSRHFRVRECISRAQQHQHHQRKQLLQTNMQLEQQLYDHEQSGAHLEPDGAPTVKPKISSSKSPVRRRRKFEALNGCLFRRDISSESMGDLCCCAGVPRFVFTQTRSAGDKTSDKNSTSTTSSPALQATQLPGSNLTDDSKSSETKVTRKYLRPQVLCFVSGASSLFNVQKLVAPIANEHNLKYAFVKDKGKCITCSCCHEHDPEKVNKLLANVPLYAYKLKTRSMMIDKNGNQLVMPANVLDGTQDSDPGLWIKIRGHLNNLMQRLDNLFFWLYDLLDLSLFVSRYGYPADFTDSSGLVLIQSSLVRPATFASRAASSARHLTKSTEMPNLLIDEDSYDDFTTTTSPSSTTSSTTRRPRRRRPLGRRKKGEKVKSRRRGRGWRRRPTGLGSSSTNAPQTTGSPELPAVSGLNANFSSTSTTKSPTVIINVYANNQASDASKALGSSGNASFTSTSIRPGLLLMAEPERGAIGRSGTNIELRIKLNDNSTTTTTTTTMTMQNSSNSNTLASSSTLSPALPTKLMLEPIQLLVPIANLSIARLVGGIGSPAPTLSLSAPPTMRPINLTNETSQSSADRILFMSDHGQRQAAEQERKPSKNSVATLTGLPSSKVTHAHRPSQSSSLAANETSSIVISVGQGNSTTIIATINTTQSSAPIHVRSPLTTAGPQAGLTNLASSGPALGGSSPGAHLPPARSTPDSSSPAKQTANDALRASFGSNEAAQVELAQAEIAALQTGAAPNAAPQLSLATENSSPPGLNRIGEPHSASPKSVPADDLLARQLSSPRERSSPISVSLNLSQGHRLSLAQPARDSGFNEDPQLVIAAPPPTFSPAANLAIRG